MQFNYMNLKMFQYFWLIYDIKFCRHVLIQLSTLRVGSFFPTFILQTNFKITKTAINCNQTMLNFEYCTSDYQTPSAAFRG